jgi:hypothetical protein
VQKHRLIDAIPLSRYVELIGYNPPAFWGINHPDNALYACREVWSEAERRMVRDALAQSQDMLEQELNYPLSPTHVTDERRRLECIALTEQCHIVEAGSLVLTYLGVATVTATGEPAVIGPVAALGHDADHLYLCFAGTDTIIEPTSTVFGSTDDVTFLSPYVRLVDPAYANNPPTGWHYADYATWMAQTVDVWGWAIDPLGAARFWQRGCATPCAEVEKDGCIRVASPHIGEVQVRPTVCAYPDRMQLLYLAYRATSGMESAIVRLAHSLMPDEPCGCAVTQRLWERDRKQGDVLTRERINCPFGMSDGAWFAWRWAQANRVMRGGRML